MTECIACTINRLGERKLGTAGYAIDGYEVAIVDADNRQLPHGEMGELIVDTTSNTASRAKAAATAAQPGPQGTRRLS